LIALRVTQISIVRDPPNVGIQSSARFQRGTLRAAIKKDVELDLELANVVLESNKLLIDLRGFVLL
jgi:hypothetical protein